MSGIVKFALWLWQANFREVRLFLTFFEVDKPISHIFARSLDTSRQCKKTSTTFVKVVSAL